MPTTYAIPNGRTVMDATLYTGNGYPTAGTQTITNNDSGTVGFKPDLIWIKSRSAAGAHSLTDSVRGTNSQLFSNLTNAQESNTDQVTAININGFLLGTNTTGTGSTNVNGVTHVAWQWQAGQGTNTTNTTGTITSTVSVNPTAGFSIATYTGTGVNATIGHGLGAAPQMIIAKPRSASGGWPVYHVSLGNTGRMYLESTAANSPWAPIWNSTSPTSTVFSVGTGTDANTNGYTYVAYCWAPVPGFSQFGSYTGNASADGPFVYLGFRPKFVMIKNSSSASDWLLLDTSRNTYNVANAALFADLSNAEDTSVSFLDILSNGFKVRFAGGAGINASGATFIYAAFAENPFKYANAR
jgi:hypothetical protein